MCSISWILLYKYKSLKNGMHKRPFMRVPSPSLWCPAGCWSDACYSPRLDPPTAAWLVSWRTGLDLQLSDPAEESPPPRSAPPGHREHRGSQIMWRKPESHELKEISVWLRTDFIKLSVCAENEGQDVQNLDPDHSTALIPDKQREKCYSWGFV